VAASVIPAVLAAALLSADSYRKHRANIEQNTLETARALTQAVDQQLASGRTALYALATSPFLASGDLAAFHEQARQALRDLPGNNIVLTDASGQQLVNTLVPFGQALPRHANPAQARQVFETGKALVSDLYAGAVMRRSLIGVDVPVRIGGEIVYDLTMGFFPSRLGEILTRQGLPPDWVGAIFDSRGTIIARTHDAERFVGEKGSPGLLQGIARSREGQVQTPTLEGIPVVAIFSHSAVSDWSVAIGIPRSELTGYLWHPLLLIVAGATLLLAAGMALARLIASRITRSITGLVAPATALGRGEKVDLPPIQVREAREVGRALVNASQLLRKRERVLAVVAHDLRNPLNTLRLRAELGTVLANRLPGAERLVQELASLSDVTRRMSGMVDDLLAVAVAGQSDRSMLNLAPLGAASLLARAVDSVRELFDAYGIALRIEASRDLPEVQVDADRVLRLFVNLLDNALKFTAVPGEVVLRAEALPDRVRFSVANSGPALAPHELDALFRPFWQAEAGDPRGAGLGLSICRSIVETHGGEIWAETEPGKRVRICFALPTTGRAASPPEPGQPPRRAVAER